MKHQFLVAAMLAMFLAACGNSENSGKPGDASAGSAASSVSKAGDVVPAAGPSKVVAKDRETVNIPGKLDVSLENIEKFASGFATGKGTKAVYVFFDPQCPHCVKFWKEANALGNVAKLVWVPVALMGQDSLVQAAAVMAATDPISLMNEHAKLMASGGKGLVVKQDAPEFSMTVKSMPLVVRNAQVLGSFKANGIPFIVSTNASGAVYTNAGGLSASDLAAHLGLELK